MGTLGARRLDTGRGLRTGQRWSMVTSCFTPSSSSTATTSSTVWSPPFTLFTVPFMPTGTRMRCSTTTVSCTTPRTSPVSTVSPTFTRGSNFHFFAWSMAGTLIPREM